MPFRCTPPIPGVFARASEHPWELAVEPFQVAPRTYYVAGQRWVGCYLIDTGAGCILIDTAVSETCPLLIDSVYKLGYQLSDIKLILISHAHVDHCGAAGMLAHLTGAKVLMSREDTEFMRACPEETTHLDARLHAQPFEVDGYFSDEHPVELGDISVRTLLTPGHTCGCTSFFWEVENPANGERYTVAMHGGVGANTMNDDYYRTSAYLTPALRTRFIDDAERIAAIPVDIALPSHPNQIEIMDRAGTYTDEGQPYRDATVWGDFLRERVRQVREYDPGPQELQRA